MRKIFSAIGNSTLENTNGNKRRLYSSSKISSYFILPLIWLSGLIFAYIDYSNHMIMKKQNLVYEIPMAHIFIYSLTLTHHLVLLGLKRGSDAKYLDATVKMKEIDAHSQAQAQGQVGYYNDNYNDYYQPPCMVPPCMRMNMNQQNYHPRNDMQRDDDNDQNRSPKRV